jgi:signal transduction histidine kinase
MNPDDRYNRSLHRRDQLLEATAKASNVLLALDNFEDAIAAALTIILEGAGCDRISILENRFDTSSILPPYCTLIYEQSRTALIKPVSLAEAELIRLEGIEVAFLEQYFLRGDGFGGLVEEWNEPLRSTLAAAQVQSAYAVPIRMKGQWWGVLCFDYCQEAIRLSLAEVAVLKMIADCVGSAIQRDRTQKTTQQVEQARTAELTKANYVLKQTVDLLANEPDLDRFLDQVLKGLAEQFESPLIQYWEHPAPGDVAYLRIACSHGQILTLADLPHDCLVTGVQIPPELTGYENMHTRKRYYIVEDVPTDPIQQAIFSPLNFNLETWCTEQGIRKLINIPLMQAEKTTGALLLYFVSGHYLSEQQIELMYALAQQVTLATQLTQLAEVKQTEAIAQERSRMAREIHDTLAQAFGGISMQLQAFNYFASSQPEKAQTHLRIAQALASDGLTEARRSVWTLYLETTEYEDPAQTIAKFIEQTAPGQSVPIHLAIEGNPYPLHPDLGLNLLRIAQESITNALRHAQAQLIQVHLSYRPQFLQLMIRDNGCGFEPQLPTRGFGLSGMQQRADRIGADWHLVSLLGEGTTITVNLTHPAAP